MGKGSLIDQAFLAGYMHYCPIVRSRWPDISQVLVCIFMDQQEVKINKTVKEKEKKNEGNIQPSWLSKLCQYMILYLAKEWTSCRTIAGKLVQQDEPTLSPRVANQNTGFGSSYKSTRRFNHMIMHVICI